MAIQIYNPQEDELKRRIAAARKAGWDEGAINRFALIDRAQNQMRSQQAAQQQAQQKQGDQPSGFARFAAGLLPIALGAAGAVGGTLFAPGAGTAAGGAAGGAAGEALRRKLLGEEQDLGSTLIEGGLGALPGVGKIVGAARAGRAVSGAAKTADEVVDASKAAKIAAQAGEGTALQGARTQRTARNSIAMRELARRAGQVGAKNADEAETAVGSLAKRATAPLAEPTEQSFRERIIQNYTGSSKPTITSTTGDLLRETQRGTRVGSKIPGTNKLLTRDSANSVNDVIDTANKGMKGGKALRGQVDKVQQMQGKVYDELTRATKEVNTPLTAEDYTQLDGLISKHIDDIGDVLDTPAKQRLIDKGLNRILYKSKDLVNLEKQRKVFDEGAKRLLQNPDTQGTANAQIQRAYRSAIDEFITSKAPQLKEVKGAYAQLRQAEDLLGARIAQMDNAKNQGGVAQLVRGSALKEGAQDVAGRALQKTGKIMGSTPVRAVKGQVVGRALTGNLGRNMGEPAPDAETQAALNPGALFDNPQGIEEQTINELVKQGITDPAQMASMLEAIQSGGSPDLLAGLGGAGGANTTGLAASSTELFNEAMRILQTTGDSDAAEQLMDLADMAMDLEKAGGGQKMTAAQQKTIMGTDTADQIINQIEQEVGGLPGGLIGGGAVSLLGRLKPGSGVGASAEAYNQSRGSKALMLIKAIQGSAGQISDVDRDMIMNAMPLTTDSPDIRRRKLESLRQITASYRGAAQSAPAAGGGGLDFDDLFGGGFGG